MNYTQEQMPRVGGATIEVAYLNPRATIEVFDLGRRERRNGWVPWNGKSLVEGRFSPDPDLAAIMADKSAIRGERESEWKARQEHDKSLIVSSGDFVSGYVAPQYLIEGILQQRRVISLTGKTGDGKTALQLYFASLLATGTPLGKREVERCRVLYLAGENPDDVRARWLAMSDALDFDAATIDVHFVEGVFSVSGQLERVRAEAEAVGGFGAVIVDTSAAYFEGDAENDNVQLGNWARMLRKLTELPGGRWCLSAVTPSKTERAYCHAAAAHS